MGTQASFEDIKELFRETDRRMDRRMAEADRRIDKLGKQIGGLGNRLGEFVEGVVRPGLVRMFRRWGLFVIGQQGEDAVLRSSEGFEPRAW